MKNKVNCWYFTVCRYYVPQNRYFHCMECISKKSRNVNEARAKWRIEIGRIKRKTTQIIQRLRSNRPDNHYSYIQYFVGDKFPQLGFIFDFWLFAKTLRWNIFNVWYLLVVRVITLLIKIRKNVHPRRNNFIGFLSS